MFELKILTGFAAAHQLTMVGEKCENLHGHNWKVEVYVTGKELDAGGVVMDFGILKKKVALIMDTLDHKFLNELEMFSDRPPSSENIALYIGKELEKSIENKRVRVSKVCAWESDNACAAYIPE